MDIVGGFALADGTSAKALTGIDDHSRMCVCRSLAITTSVKEQPKQKRQESTDFEQPLYSPLQKLFQAEVVAISNHASP